MSPMIEVSALTKRFGDVTAVDAVSFEVLPGELLTLLGPSGCGKTTLLRLLSGFERPTNGLIRIDGTDVTTWPPNRRDVNQVFQSYALFPHLTVRENVAFGLKMQRRSSAEIGRKVADVLSLVSLEGMGDRYPHELSGGQRQRVALARAIVPNPRILLLDEPLSALDAKLRRSMQLEIKRLQKQLGLTTILVTHDQDEALALSDRVAVMNGGRIEQLDTPERIYRAPRNAFVAEFIGEANVFPAKIVSSTLTESGIVELKLNVSGTLTLSAKEKVTDAGSPLPQAGRVSVRPENIHVTASAAQVENEFAVRLIEKIFLGSTVRANVETVTKSSESAALRFTVFQPASSFIADATLGTVVYCSCSGDDVVLLR